MKILLTGAGGSIGFETLKQFMETDNEITVLDLDTRKNRKRLSKYSNNATIIYGSINDTSLIDKIVPLQDIIIHLAAVIPPLADRNPELTRKVNFYGTQNIVNAIMNSDKKPFLLYTSSVSVYGDRLENYWIKVGDTLNPSDGDYYAETKIATEAMIKESGIDYSIFRLTGIMGHPATDPLMFHMPLETKLEIASVEDTAYALVKSVNYIDELKNKTFNLSGGEKCRTTYREFIANMFKIYGLNIRYLKDVAFAEHNFHCGYYLDSNELNDILSFQQDTIDSYYNRVKHSTKGIIRFFAKIFSRPSVYFLMKKSEPLLAKKRNDINLIDRFFKTEREIMKEKKMNVLLKRKGFIAALDQSGGSSKKTLLNYGISENEYKDEEEMFLKIHDMRKRIIMSPVFSKDKILGVILFKNTMERKIDDLYTADYLWNKKEILSFLKIDLGLDALKNGVQLLKDIPNIDETLELSLKYNIFGTKMRSVIKEANEEGIKALVNQQFSLAKVISSYGLIPIIEPEVDINAKDKAVCEELLLNEVKNELKKLDSSVNVIFKFTLPTKENFYDELLTFNNVLKLVALSGGYERDIANSKLKNNKNMIASFSRALLEGLSIKQKENEFDNVLNETINSIYDASINKIE